MTRPHRGPLAALTILAVALVLPGCGSTGQTPDNQTPAAAPALSDPRAAHNTPLRVTEDDPATMGRVVDGDTIVADLDPGPGARNEYVRLLTIQAPELRKRTTPDDDDCGAVASTQGLAAELDQPGEPLTLRALAGEPDRDYFNRLLRVVYSPIPTTGAPIAPVNINVLMVERGFARHYDRYPTSDSTTVLGAEARARAADAGNWATCPDWRTGP